jgi:nucleoside-diphosphate-sugar epimerase
MKIVVIGAPGTIGRAIVAELGAGHDIVEVGKSRGALRVDLLDTVSVRDLFAKIGAFDAVVTAAGNAHFGPLTTMTPFASA